MPKNAFAGSSTRDLLISPKTTQRHFLFTPHPLSMVIFATATVLAFVLLRNSNFNFHCYTEREATPTQKSAPEVRCDLSRLLSRTITKRIHSSKPASLNRLIPVTPDVTSWVFIFIKRIWFSLAPKAVSSSHQNFSLELFPLRLPECGLTVRVLF